MRKGSIIILCLSIIFSFVACNNDKNATSENITSYENNSSATFAEIENKTVIANDGTEYTFIGIEGQVWCFGELDFIDHVKGEKNTFVHLTEEIKTGMYSVNGKKDVLLRYFPDNEFASIYVKSGLLKTDITLENCIRFEFVKGLLFNHDKTKISKKGITECKQFLDEIKSGHKAKDAGLYDLVMQTDGMFNNYYVYGYVCGVLQDDINVVIPLEVMSFDDKAYSIKIDDIEYVLTQEWIDKLKIR